jgi:microcystin degradation protein MlrC
MSRAPRVLFAGLFHETHTFLDLPTGPDGFEFRHGEEMLACLGDASPTGGALALARELGWQAVPLLDARAQPSGIVEDEVFEGFWREFQRRASQWQESDVDAIYLVLHGAMATRSLVDPEGELLCRIRSRLGWTVPIAAVLDLHANVTPLMAEHGDLLTAYRENPHADARESAERLVRHLDRTMREKLTVHTAWRGTDIVWVPAGTGTFAMDSPMARLEAMARRAEREGPGVIELSVCAGFAFADTPHTGVSFLLAHTPECADPQAVLAPFVEAAWRWREEGNVRGRAPAAVLAELEGPGPFILAEDSDNIGGGAPGDGTGLLRALLEADAQDAAVCIADPEAVEQLWSLAPGERVTVSIGGRGSQFDAGPVSLELEVERRSKGRFELEDKRSHLASLCGDAFEMGPTVLARHRGLRILLTSRATPPLDLGQWRSLGLDPSTLRIIGVKAAVAHRRAYDPIARGNHLVETPGPCCSDLTQFPFRHLRRPVFPLDPDAHI